MRDTQALQIRATQRAHVEIRRWHKSRNIERFADQSIRASPAAAIGCAVQAGVIGEHFAHRE